MRRFRVRFLTRTADYPLSCRVLWCVVCSPAGHVSDLNASSEQKVPSTRADSRNNAAGVATIYTHRAPHTQAPAPYRRPAPSREAAAVHAPERACLV
jgi:hypothetical protein